MMPLFVDHRDETWRRRPNANAKLPRLRADAVNNALPWRRETMAAGGQGALFCDVYSLLGIKSAVTVFHCSFCRASRVTPAGLHESVSGGYWRGKLRGAQEAEPILGAESDGPMRRKA